MTSHRGWAVHILLLLGLSEQGTSFAYAGIGLGTDLKTVAARYPHSTLQGNYLRLAPEDIHDHISVVEISGTGPGRRARISFELQRRNGVLDYPRCTTLEAELASTFGVPKEIRRFTEEASPRADRIWRSGAEEMTLICFRGASRGYWAEAVEITPRSPSDGFRPNPQMQPTGR